jgi:hypothetical protein
MKQPQLNFELVNAEAITHLLFLVQVWLPGGKRQGKEYIARNPRREDRNLGSFSINTITGRWCDFASGDRGGDPVSLYAYIHGIGQVEAGKALARELGVRHEW